MKETVTVEGINLCASSCKKILLEEDIMLRIQDRSGVNKDRMIRFKLQIYHTGI